MARASAGLIFMNALNLLSVNLLIGLLINLLWLALNDLKSRKISYISFWPTCMVVRVISILLCILIAVRAHHKVFLRLGETQLMVSAWGLTRRVFLKTTRISSQSLYQFKICRLSCFMI